MSPEFLITSLIVVASPGTGAIVTLAAGLSQGPRAALLAATGCTLGVLPHMLAAISGLAALLCTSAVAFQVVQYAGVAFLLYLAWTSLRSGGPLQISATADTGTPARSGQQLVTHAILVNLLNPKLSMFFLAFLPQFVSPAAPGATQQMLVLSGVFMAMTWVVFAAYGVFAAKVRRHVMTRPSVLLWMRRSFAAALAALAVKLALVQR